MTLASKCLTVLPVPLPFSQTCELSTSVVRPLSFLFLTRQQTSPPNAAAAPVANSLETTVGDGSDKPGGTISVVVAVVGTCGVEGSVSTPGNTTAGVVGPGGTTAGSIGSGSAGEQR